MDKFFVADSYKDFEIVGEPYVNTFKGNRMYVKVKGVCSRCGGCGHYSYNQFDGTICYGCNGTGISVQSVRAYSKSEYDALQRAKAARQAKVAAEKEAHNRDLMENADKYKSEAMVKRGFSADGKAYLVYGNDTYSIKDQLKEMGARFDAIMKWYFAEKVELPEGYHLCEVDFDEICEYQIMTKWIQFKENAKEIVSEKIASLSEPSTSVYYPGAIGERIRNISAKIDSIRGFNGRFGYTKVYTFSSGDYVFVWMTAKDDLNLLAGDNIILTGTIKNFNEYMGVNQTNLTRCVVKRVGA